jgi:predicted metal-dependent phosphoesterase TrpH
VRVDLHCHSTWSDGTEPPGAVRARAGELAAFALTDHDTCAGCDATGARCAVELSCDHDGRTIHVLAYDRGCTGWADLEAQLDRQQEARKNRLRVMAAKLAMRGIRIDVEPLLALQRSVGRPDLARAMVAGGWASSVRDAFARHLYDGGPIDVPHRGLSLVDALALGRAANAAMSLAHPHLYDPSLLRRYRAEGLTGVEAFYRAYDPTERARWIDLADQLGLVCTGGSDAHGPDDPLGVDVPDDRGDALLAWLHG